MPYVISKSKEGYFVKTKETGKKHSHHPLSKEMAEKQMRKLYMIMKGKE